MDEKQFNEKWGNVNADNLTEKQLEMFKHDCFQMYEQTGFIERFNSPYDENSEHNGMKFRVIRRATRQECDLESMPLWLIEFENGHTAYCYPEEICTIEH